MSLLKFLQSSAVEDVKIKPSARGGAKKQWNPPPAIVAIRVWKDGSVFPSQAAIDKFDLEYKNCTITKEAIKLKEGETEADQKYRNVYDFPNGTGNGFDIIDSRIWQQLQSTDDGGGALFIIPIPKDAGKVDLFNTVAYDDPDGTGTGVPKSSVRDQGTITFGEQVLIPAIEGIYGIKFNRDEIEASEGVTAEPAITDGVDFVDMVIFEEVKVGDTSFNVTQHYSKSILFVPKRITRGSDKGKADYVRRENTKVYGFAPAKDVLAEYNPDNQPAEDKPVTT